MTWSLLKFCLAASLNARKPGIIIIVALIEDKLLDRQPLERRLSASATGAAHRMLPLHYAATHQAGPQMVHFLLEKCANLLSTLGDSGRNALDYALDDGQLENVRYLISECGFPLDEYVGSQG